MSTDSQPWRAPRRHRTTTLVSLGVAIVLGGAIVAIATLSGGIQKKSGGNQKIPNRNTERLSSPTTVAPALLTPHVYSVPSTIPSNCTADASSALTTWIDSVPDGSTISFPPDGCYRVDQAVKVVNRNSLSFLGNGTTFRRTSLSPPTLTYPHSNPYWQVHGGSNISMSNMSVVGPNVSSSTHVRPYDFEEAFGFFGVNGVSLTHLSAATVGGDGLTIGGENSSECDEHVSVNGITVDNVGRQGVAIVCVNGATFDNAMLDHPGGLAPGMSTGFDFEPIGATASVRNVEIENSQVRARVIAFSAKGVRDVSNIYIHNNTVLAQDSDWPWVLVSRGRDGLRHDWRVISNTVDITLYRPALSFSSVDNIEIEDNISPVGVRQAAVTLTDDCGSIIIAGNQFGEALAPTASQGTTC